jgi:hypothetical protein
VYLGALSQLLNVVAIACCAPINRVGPTCGLGIISSYLGLQLVFSSSATLYSCPKEVPCNKTLRTNKGTSSPPAVGPWLEDQTIGLWRGGRWLLPFPSANQSQRQHIDMLSQSTSGKYNIFFCNGWLPSHDTYTCFLLSELRWWTTCMESLEGSSFINLCVALLCASIGILMFVALIFCPLCWYTMYLIMMVVG